MALIELGELRDEVPRDARPPLPSWVSSRRVRTAAVLTLLLATLSAGAPGARPLAEATIPAGLGATVIVEGDLLLVADPPGNPGTPVPHLAAFRLPDAEPRWRVPLPVPGKLGTAALVGQRVVVTSQVESVASSPETVAVDAVTGRVSWRQVAQFEAVTTEDDVLLWVGQVDPAADPAGPAAAGPGAPGTLRVVNPVDGTIRWSYRLPDGAVRFYRPAGAKVSSVLLRLPTGRVEVRDVASGRVTRTADLPVTGEVPQAGWAVDVVGDLLLVTDGRDTVSAYGLDRLEFRWTAARNVGGNEFGPVPCGAAPCFFGPQGGLRRLDPATGRTSWSDPRWSPILPLVGDFLVVVGSGTSAGAAELTVLDAATGQVRGALGRWEVVERPAGSGRLTGIRFNRDRRAWIADLDPATRTVRILAVLRDVSGGCYAQPSALVCRRLDGALGVWRLG